MTENVKTVGLIELGMALIPLEGFPYGEISETYCHTISLNGSKPSQEKAIQSKHTKASKNTHKRGETHQHQEWCVPCGSLQLRG